MAQILHHRTLVVQVRIPQAVRGNDFTEADEQVVEIVSRIKKMIPEANSATTLEGRTSLVPDRPPREVEPPVRVR